MLFFGIVGQTFSTNFAYLPQPGKSYANQMGLGTQLYFRPLRIQVKTLIPASSAVFLGVLFWQLILNVLIN